MINILQLVCVVLVAKCAVNAAQDKTPSGHVNQETDYDDGQLLKVLDLNDYFEKNRIERQVRKRSVLGSLQKRRVLWKRFGHLPRYCKFGRGKLSCLVLVNRKWMPLSKVVKSKLTSPQYRTSQKQVIVPQVAPDFKVTKAVRGSYLSNIVKIGGGCTGTLITPQHVLTAAHCIHNGRNFIDSIHMLKVAVPDSFSLRIYYVADVYVSRRWKASVGRDDISRAVFDYAVLRLHVRVSGSRSFMKFSAKSKRLSGNQRIFFTGFSRNESSSHEEIWQSSCVITPYSPMLFNSLIISRCRSMPGMSGAAACIETEKGDKEIVGVVSNMIARSEKSLSQTDVAVVAKLNKIKLYNVCNYLGGDGIEICS